MSADRIVVKFEIPGQPVAKQRPKFTRNGSNYGRAYTPKETVSFENWVKHRGTEAMNGRDPLNGALRMSVVITLTPPQSWSEKRKREALAGEIAPTKRPDADNVVKAVVDGLIKVVYDDDSRIVDLHARKVYGAKAGVAVEVEQLNVRPAP